MSKMNSVIAIFESHNQAEEAVRELEKSKVDMKKLSIVGKWNVPRNVWMSRKQ